MFSQTRKVCNFFINHIVKTIRQILAVASVNDNTVNTVMRIIGRTEYKAFYYWPNELSICQYTPRSQGQRDYVQHDRDGQREWSGSVCLSCLDLSHRAGNGNPAALERILPFHASLFCSAVKGKAAV